MLDTASAVARATEASGMNASGDKCSSNSSESAPVAVAWLVGLTRPPGLLSGLLKDVQYLSSERLHLAESVSLDAVTSEQCVREVKR